MVRLGLQLTLRSGREALVRALMIAAAVAIGVTVLLAVLRRLPRLSGITSNRAVLGMHTGGGRRAPRRAPSFGTTARTFTRASSSRCSTWPPSAPSAGRAGLDQAPGAGQYYASPALANLIKSVPGDELGDRFPGSEVGTIGYQALSGPNELVAIVGYPPATLAALPGTVTVDHIATAPDVQGRRPSTARRSGSAPSWSCSRCSSW